ncbi:hypothetical protein [Desulfomonile tiedjei]|uniref:Uncharacterized protein n=1 Tax=Desulfomonile tiedjei (strain ATCC 49306 / DSM 6799 / DCB-1) TaxID=706587 RepID=I4CCK0_DESTA|nr:hypothetical protein [Desulfomonile tiedjei]AFM27291.1 hypothetical protein Desti_4669 [Desulfomonile tiedjei DSM 6799]
MCVDGVSHLVMNDETIQALMANPILDLVHKQVVMSLYAMDSNHELSTYKEMLPLYLGTDWESCEAILKAIEKAGLLTRTPDGIALVHPVKQDVSASCGCAM